MIREKTFCTMMLLVWLAIFPNLSFASDDCDAPKTIVRVGHEPLPVMLNCEGGCYYICSVKADKIGEVEFLAVEKVCVSDDEQKSEKVAIKAVIKSEIIENKLTGEKVNQIAEGTKIVLKK